MSLVRWPKLDFDHFIHPPIQAYVYVLYPMSAVAFCASIYMTLAVTVERYIAVCRPHQHRNIAVVSYQHRNIAVVSYQHRNIAVVSYHHRNIAVVSYQHRNIALVSFQNRKIALVSFLHRNIAAVSFQHRNIEWRVINIGI